MRARVPRRARRVKAWAVGAVNGRLFIPVIDADSDTLSAALQYTAGGFYVGPVKRGSKHPGSVLGEKWQTKTSRDREVIVSMFAGTDHGVFLHCGRSGMVGFDVDHPDEVPLELVDAINNLHPPRQSTRRGETRRCHYVFAVPEGRTFGNGAGKLGKRWGEVRGANGVIVVAPSLHENAAEGGFYEWLQTGEVPVLPESVAALLPDRTEAVDAATDDEVRSFLDMHTTGDLLNMLVVVEEKFSAAVAEGASRHDSAIEHMCWAMREARAGYYPARTTAKRLQHLFVQAITSARRPDDRVLTDVEARSEYAGIAAWAIAQAKTADVVAIRRRVEQRMSGLAESDPPPWDTPEPIAKIARMPLPASVGREPATLWAMVDAVAVSYQVPRDMAFMLILAILATAVGGRRRVRVAPDWTEVVSLYTVVLAPSGERKSPVLAAVSAPLVAIETDLQLSAAPKVAEARARRDLYAAAVDKIKRSGKTDPGTRAKLDDAVRELEAIHVPVIPRLLADDSTPEVMARLMAQQGGRLGVLSAEGGLLSILAGRYSSGVPNLDLVLKAWSGDPYRVDRISRDPVILTEPVLSIGFAIQPDVVAGLAEVRHFRGAGLLARFLYSLPSSLVGTRQSQAFTSVPEQVAADYRQAITALVKAVRESEQTSEIRLDGDARQLLDTFRDDLEPRLHPETGDLAHIADWANKLAGQLVRIAALFALYTDPHTAKIAENHMREALDLAPYFIRHAQTSFELMSGCRSPLGPPAAVLAWIRRKKLTDFTVRQAWRDLGGQAWVTKTDDVREAVADLIDLGWVRPARESTERSRGRPSERYDVHPDTHKDTAKNADMRYLVDQQPSSGNFGSASDAQPSTNGVHSAMRHVARTGSGTASLPSPGQNCPTPGKKNAS